MNRRLFTVFDVKQRHNRAFSFLLAIVGLCMSASAQNTKFVTFDAPGAVYGTYVSSINDRGDVTGYYVDGNGVVHGLFRSSEGVVTDFSAPHASRNGYGTFGIAVNLEREVVGYYTNSKFNYGGFVRMPDGTFETYRYPNACTSGDPEGCEGTGFAAINAFGIIAGGYIDKTFVQHALLRTPDGKVITYDAPGAGKTPGSPANISPLGDYLYQGTNLAGISPGLNLWGAVTSAYLDENNVYHGYLRTPEGNFTDFDAPDAGKGLAQGTVPISLNDLGVITGFYLDSNNVYHAFLGEPDALTDFDAPDADTTDAYYGTQPASVNDFGAITGYYLDASSVWHGFLRGPDGRFMKLDAPGADLTPGNFNGTFPSQINLFGVIAGFYIDAKSVAHGFLRIPCTTDCQNDEQAVPGVHKLPTNFGRKLIPFRRQRFSVMTSAHPE